MRKFFQNKIYSLLLILLIFSCKEKGHEYHSLIDKIKSESVEFNKDSIVERPQYQVENLTEIYEDETFFLVQNRKNIVKSYACNECHSEPVAELQTEGLGKKAHWHIQLNHADDNTMSCLTCHVDNDMNNLKSITGNTIDFNYSHQLCNQCHNKEVTDWIGGAHGKNLSGWKGARVSKLCVECHNPHKPAIEKRWPSRYNTKMVNSRK